MDYLQIKIGDLEVCSVESKLERIENNELQ